MEHGCLFQLCLIEEGGGSSQSSKKQEAKSNQSFLIKEETSHK
jgi:hypothetical protein